MAAIAKPAEFVSSSRYFRRRCAGDPPPQRTLPAPGALPFGCRDLGDWVKEEEGRFLQKKKKKAKKGPAAGTGKVQALLEVVSKWGNRATLRMT